MAGLPEFDGHYQFESAPLIADCANLYVYQSIRQGVIPDDVLGQVGGNAGALLIPGHPDHDTRVLRPERFKGSHAFFKNFLGCGKEVDPVRHLAGSA